MLLWRVLRVLWTSWLLRRVLRVHLMVQGRALCVLGHDRLRRRHLLRVLRVLRRTRLRQRRLLWALERGAARHCPLQRHSPRIHEDLPCTCGTAYNELPDGIEPGEKLAVWYQHPIQACNKMWGWVHKMFPQFPLTLS